MAKSLREMKRQRARDMNYLRKMEASPMEIQQAALFRNGITEADLEKERKHVWKEATRLTQEFAFRTIYAAILITMCRDHGWDPDKVADLLVEIDKQVLVCIEDQELVRLAYEQTGISLEWNDPIERIKREDKP